jgi:hypothetical protein
MQFIMIQLFGIFGVFWIIARFSAFKGFDDLGILPCGLFGHITGM